jgi:hypothetical protein
MICVLAERLPPLEPVGALATGVVSENEFAGHQIGPVYLVIGPPAVHADIFTAGLQSVAAALLQSQEATAEAVKVQGAQLGIGIDEIAVLHGHVAARYRPDKIDVIPLLGLAGAPRTAIAEAPISGVVPITGVAADPILVGCPGKLGEHAPRQEQQGYEDPSKPGNSFFHGSHLRGGTAPTGFSVYRQTSYCGLPSEKPRATGFPTTRQWTA